MKSMRIVLFSYILLAAIAVGPAAAQGGTYAATGPMVRNRDLHTMTTLPDGKVLIAGGEDQFAIFGGWNDAEIYDPVANTFTLLSSVMGSMRLEHTATLLANGKVLIVGGQYQDCCQFNGNYGPRPVAGADLYDPATQTFSPAGTLATGRYEHAAVRLADGRVLVTGGFTDINFGDSTTASAEIYDPATHSFSPTGSMTIQRAAQSMILLPGGKVLVVGGNGTVRAKTADLFDPATGTFTATAAPPVFAETDAGLFLQPDGTVLVIGSGNAIERYTPATGTFTSVGSTLHGYSFHDAKIALGDGRILLAGHHVSEIYDPATNTSVDAGNPGIDLFGAAAPLSGNRALVTGGETFVPFAFVASSQAQIFTPAVNTPPVANPGADRTISPGAGCLASVTLDGSGSSDANGDALTYSWAEGTTVLGTGASIPVSLARGAHLIALTVDDGHGGTDTRTVTITITDTTAPTFVVPGPVTLEQTGPGGTVYTPAIPVAADNCDANPVVKIDGVPAGSLFPSGTTTLTYTATDADGNNDSSTTTVTVHDTTAPVVVVPADMIAEQTGPGGSLVHYTVTATDAATPGPALVCIPAADTIFPAGTTTVQCTATDAALNSASASFKVTVRDTIAPAIAITSPNGGVYGVMQAVNAAYSCSDSGSGLASCAGPVPSGALLDTSLPGPHTFTVIATDAAGNASTASVAYRVAGINGRMNGEGWVLDGRVRQHFEFSATTDGDDDRDDGARLRVWTDATSFESTSVTAIAFWHDPSIQPGRGARQPQADSVILAGSGQWNGLGGYTFTARASDRGEPGVNHDRVAITVFDPSGVVVAAFDATLGGGNIQSLPVHGR
jgi:hypothetical protein